MFEFSYSIGDIKNFDLGEGIVCLGREFGDKGERSGGMGGREVGGKGEGSGDKGNWGVRGEGSGECLPPVHPLILGWSTLCINDHRTQNQSLKQALLAFYEKFPVWKLCHFGRHFKKCSHQMDRCIGRTNCYRVLPDAIHICFYFGQLPVLKRGYPQTRIAARNHLHRSK